MNMLQRETLLSSAREQTGLDDFGDTDFLEPLDRLLHCLNTEAGLNAAGEMMLSQQYIQLLVNRLRFQDDLNKHPEIRQEPLSPPLVVIGLPRSGTTKFHRILAAHPDTQSLPLWKLMNPAPIPSDCKAATDPRIAFAQGAIDLMAELHPETLAGHPMAAEEAEEESQYLMEMTFDGALVPVRARVPSFAAWRWQRSMLPCYRYLRQLLQYLQWQSPGSTDKPQPYVLKNPLHLGHIDALLEVFPGATIVHCHRDPVESVPSFARLLEVGWQMVCDRSDPAECGDAAMELLHSHIERYLAMRPGLESGRRFIDITFQDIVEDAYSAAARCFEQHGLPYNTGVQTRIQQWQDANPTPEQGQHRYTLERYGLTEQAIRRRFHKYYDRLA